MVCLQIAVNKYTAQCTELKYHSITQNFTFYLPAFWNAGLDLFNILHCGLCEIQTGYCQPCYIFDCL